MSSRRPSPKASAPRTARALAHAQIEADILDVARRQMSEVGAAGLSLRAVARELGMVSSAVYRYVASRDELLTRLLIRSYDDLGETLERNDAALDQGDLLTRWRVLCRGVWDWAHANPQDYALLYGSPVPGYRAPERTIAPAQRVTRRFSILIEAVGQSGLDAASVALSPDQRVALEPLHAFVTEVVGTNATRTSDAVVQRGVQAWATVFGVVSMDLFGHFGVGVVDGETFFSATVDTLALDLGLSLP